MKLLDGGVVGVFVGDEKCSLGRAPVRVEPFLSEQPVVQQDVVDVHGAVEGEGHHLGKAGDVELPLSDPGGLGAVSGAETFGQNAEGGVTDVSSDRGMTNFSMLQNDLPVGILLHAAGVLIASVSAVRLLVAEELPGQTLPVPALEQTLGAHRVSGHQVGLHQAGLGQLVTVEHLEQETHGHVSHGVSQNITFAFQSQICFLRSNARPEGHLMEASLMVPAIPALSHLTTSRQSPDMSRISLSLADVGHPMPSDWLMSTFCCEPEELVRGPTHTQLLHAVLKLEKRHFSSL